MSDFICRFVIKNLGETGLFMVSHCPFLPIAVEDTFEGMTSCSSSLNGQLFTYLATILSSSRSLCWPWPSTTLNEAFFVSQNNQCKALSVKKLHCNFKFIYLALPLYFFLSLEGSHCVYLQPSRIGSCSVSACLSVYSLFHKLVCNLHCEFYFFYPVFWFGDTKSNSHLSFPWELLKYWEHFLSLTHI